MSITRWAVDFWSRFYRQAPEIELGRRRIPFEAQKQLTIKYKEYELRKKYKADFVCFNQIIVEIKACDALTAKDEAQLINYLKATKMRVGILANFCSIVSLEWKRYVV